MPQYDWTGTKKTGEVVSGVMTADSKDAVSRNLQRQNIMVTKIKEKGKEFALPKFGGSVTTKELAIFTRQFSVMIDAGLPITQCLEILASQQENKFFQRIIFGIREDVEAGANLSDALRKAPKVFDDLYCNLVQAGEAGGILDTILQRLSVYIEKNVKLKAAVKSALIYPVVVVVVAILIVALIMWKVIPTFASLFAGLGAKLPMPTRVVIAISNFLGSWWWLIGISIAALIIALRTYYATPGGRYNIDKITLKLPVLGIVLKKIAVARFCRTLGTLVSSGVPILEGLDITAKTSGNAVVEEAIMKTRKSVEEGKTIVEPLQATKLFPGMVTQMIGVGESTGALDAMLSKIADFYEDEVDEAIANLMSLLEPLIIVFLGTTVGGIVIAMYMPLFSLIQQIQ
ncbi:MAG TPA: type II secretion system F family protein [Acidobacteriota bacterium]|jgi:type IV pilus assembly protein PilC|nr:type II secretion system F family protein [Acidobacteriota bacterium]HNT18464.1 type II secretion system F family protein [Acidobacteriota bacterium]HQO20955.1 type II secretion system F family protein [Acidobacteriota bacterium]